MEGLGINLGYLLVQVFNFLIIFAILAAWMYKPLLNMMQQRRETIAKGLEDARIVPLADLAGEDVDVDIALGALLQCERLRPGAEFQSSVVATIAMYFWMD